MSVFTRHRNGASKSLTTGTTTRAPHASSVTSRMPDHRNGMPVTLVGGRLSI